MSCHQIITNTLGASDTPLTNDEISQKTGIPYNTVKVITGRMRTAGEVQSVLTGTRDGGRTKHRLVTK